MFGLSGRVVTLDDGDYKTYCDGCIPTETIGTYVLNDDIFIYDGQVDKSDRIVSLANDTLILMFIKDRERMNVGAFGTISEEFKLIYYKLPNLLKDVQGYPTLTEKKYQVNYKDENKESQTWTFLTDTTFIQNDGIGAYKALHSYRILKHAGFTIIFTSIGRTLVVKEIRNNSIIVIAYGRKQGKMELVEIEK